ncbi:hypothetical protein UFOVP605_11 [uncultured Caudovirales phage]|uniref:Uncharacterized protein n=1 Tax=uncultured Caudovirales phage TaxID=2100421 RepID=A0A6J5N1B4_9CAUD|nr:hypothetical protein UFOVP605_11 [uncultured Caudovirales phage]
MLGKGFKGAGVLLRAAVGLCSGFKRQMQGVLQGIPPFWAMKPCAHSHGTGQGGVQTCGFLLSTGVRAVFLHFHNPKTATNFGFCTGAAYNSRSRGKIPAAFAQVF